jgi:hypothetical protein
MAEFDLVDWPAGRTLAISGPAGSLRIPLTLRNASAEPAQLAEASLAEVRLAGAGAPLRVEPLPMQMIVAGHSVGRTNLRLRLDPATPPGRYEGEVKLGGLARPVAIEVIAEAKLSIRPPEIVVDAAKGHEQVVAAALENQGNVALTIDLAGAYPLAVERQTAPDRLEVDTANPVAAVLDRLTGRAPRPALEPFGELELAMPGGPIQLQPGAAAVVEVAVRLPHGLSPTRRYHTFAPLYASDLHIVIVTAAKPGLKPASAAKGAEA